MNAKEMHIGLDLVLRKLNSTRLGSLLPEEKDWLLTEAQLQFIRNRVNAKSNPLMQGFEETTARYQDIQNVLVNKAIPVYKRDAGSVFAFIPSNCMIPLKGVGKVAISCDEIASTEVPQSIYYCVVPFADDTAVAAPYYTPFKLELTNLALATSTLFSTVGTAYAGGLPTIDSKFELINLTLEELNSIPGLEVRWERWNDLYFKDSFIFFFTDTVTGLPVNNTSVTLTNGLTVTVNNFTSIVLTTLTNTITDLVTVPIRLGQSNMIEDLLIHSAGKTIPMNPLGEIEGDKFITYHTKKFILNGMQFRFIRKPRRISLVLNQSCELRPTVHEQVVNLAADRLKAILAAQDYPLSIKQNSIQE